ncbi:hypothetical protein [Streptomyces buecherae]|uniref:hypothetical protein n=1 Tax=Streptomyces buecherae TaxID=2763006 RepID=UPI00368B3D3F
MTTADTATRGIDGRFELLEERLGRGMGPVWRARDAESHREVALKEVRPPDPRYVENASRGAAVARERPVRGSRALARLRHPHVAAVFHVVTGREGGFPWLVTRLARAARSRAGLTAPPLAPVEAARPGRGPLTGLAAAHTAGIAHATSSRPTC